MLNVRLLCNKWIWNIKTRGSKGPTLMSILEVVLTSTKNRSYDRLQDAYIDVFQCHITTIDSWKLFWQVQKTDHMTDYKTRISMFFNVISQLSILGSFLTSTKNRSYYRLKDAYIDVFHCHITTIDSLKFFWQVQKTYHMTDYKTHLPRTHFLSSGKEQNCYILKKLLSKVRVFTH